MMITTFWITSIIFITIANFSLKVKGYASKMKNACERPLLAGTVIMNQKSVTDINTKALSITRNNVLLLDNQYISNELLSITLSPVDTENGEQWIFESTKGQFIDNSPGNLGCSNKRIINHETVTLQMPDISAGEVTIVAAWSNGGVVTISNKYILTPLIQQGQSNFPTISPSNSSTGNSDLSATAVMTDNFDLSIGLFMLFGFIVIKLLFICYRVSKYNTNLDISSASTTNNNNPTLTPIISYKQKSYIFATISVTLCFISMILLSQWMTDNGAGYLGTPDWTINPIVSHVALMVNGFLFMQVLAIVSWSTLGVTFNYNKNIAKLIHILCQIIGIIILFIGLSAAIKDKNDNNELPLITLHSWLGIATITIYGCAFMIGCLMAFLKQYYPQSSLRTVFEWLIYHKSFGVVALSLTGVTIVTGMYV